MRLRAYSILLSAVLIVACAAGAGAAGEMQGTVYLKGGKVISGNIKTAEMGIMDGTGIGSDLTANGAINIKTDAGEVRVAAADIALVEATWQEVTEAGGSPWQIAELKITRRDGSVVTGTPNWFMHASSVAVEQDNGEVVRILAYPLGESFSPDDLLVKVELAAAPAPTPTPTPAPTPDPTPAPTPAPTPTPDPTPAPTPAPTPTPDPTPAPTPAPTPTPDPTPAPTPAPAPHGEMQVSDVHVLPSQDMVVTIACPNCGEKITLILGISALKGLATGASGVSIQPAIPATP